MNLGGMKRMTKEELFEICNGCTPSSRFRFSCIAFEDMDFSEIPISFATFENCFFGTSVFNGNKIIDVTFKKCTFENVDFIECDFREDLFDQCELNNVYFNKSIMNIYFLLCNFVSVEFYASTVYQLTMTCCRNNGNCSFPKSKLYDVTFAHSDPVRFEKCCPEKGSFIAWKKALLYRGEERKSILVKLRIPADAKRTTFSIKCRADKVEVLGFEDLDGTPITVGEGEAVHSFMFSRKGLEYIAGKMVYPDLFDEAEVTCSNGIHFFYEKQEAIDYGC